MSSSLFHLPQAGTAIPASKSPEQAKSALRTNCIFTSWCIDIAIYMVLSFSLNLQQLTAWESTTHFPRQKKNKGNYRKTGQEQICGAAQNGNWHLDCTLCYEIHQRISECCLNITTWPLPRPCRSQEVRKMWILRSIIPFQKYTQFEQEWEIHIPDTSEKPSC